MNFQPDCSRLKSQKYDNRENFFDPIWSSVIEWQEINLSSESCITTRKDFQEFEFCNLMQLVFLNLWFDINKIIFSLSGANLDNQ